MFPRSPLPHDPSVSSHLLEIIGVDRPALLFAARPSPSDSCGGVGRHRPRAEQQYVAITQPSRIMMLIRLSQLPEDLTVPVNLSHHSPVIARAANKAVVRFVSAVEERSSLGQIAV